MIETTFRAVLTRSILLYGYRNGVFPMAVNDTGDIQWFSPDPRALIPLDDRFHVSRSLRSTMRKCPYEVSFNTDFHAVITACSITHGKTWISQEIIDGYCALHDAGYAHSVETRLNGTLVGGLYGVHIGGAFFGESMFHTATDASKIALVSLVEHLRKRRFALLDTQWTTPHLSRFGTFLVPKREYLELLHKAVAMHCTF